MCDAQMGIQSGNMTTHMIIASSRKSRRTSVKFLSLYLGGAWQPLTDSPTEYVIVSSFLIALKMALTYFVCSSISPAHVTSLALLRREVLRAGSNRSRYSTQIT